MVYRPSGDGIASGIHIDPRSDVRGAKARGGRTAKEVDAVSGGGVVA